MKPIAAAFAFAASVLIAAAPAVSPAIQRALANPARADQAQDDARRQAAAVLAFSGVKPGDRVIDLLPGKNFYWTRIFAGIVGPNGQVTALWPQRAAATVTQVQPTFDGWKLANASTAAVDLTSYKPARPVDLVWTVQNYHDLLNVPDDATAKINAAVFAALRPGGTYLIIDHADAPGSGISGTNTKHRVDPAVVKAQVTKAGFRFAGESDVLRNPADDHSKAVFDPSIRGHTDQFVYKFVKP